MTKVTDCNRLLIDDAKLTGPSMSLTTRNTEPDRAVGEVEADEVGCFTGRTDGATTWIHETTISRFVAFCSRSQDRVATAT